MIGVIIIIIVLVIVALYFWGAQLNETTPTSPEEQPLSTANDTESISADLQATAVENSDSDLTAMEGEMN
jgi:flagellar basal body-associated protein FliL